MSITLPEIRVGDPLRHESLSVFPLFSDAVTTVDYRLSDDALADESLRVEEVDVGQAKMPSPNELPSSIRQLAYQQAAELRAGRDYKRNIAALIAAIDRYFPSS